MSTPSTSVPEDSSLTPEACTFTIAIDFDGTLTEPPTDYPEIGAPRESVIALCRSLRAQGHRLILNTLRERASIHGDVLQPALDWCAAHGLAFDAVNDNLPDDCARWGNNPRKISADYYLDDRAVPMGQGVWLDHRIATLLITTLHDEAMTDDARLNPRHQLAAAQAERDALKVEAEGLRTRLAVEERKCEELAREVERLRARQWLSRDSIAERLATCAPTLTGGLYQRCYSQADALLAAGLIPMRPEPGSTIGLPVIDDREGVEGGLSWQSHCLR